MLTATILFALFLLFILKVTVIVPARATYVHERLGKFRSILEPGLHIMVPVIDRIAYRHEMREQLLDVPPQSCITRDNIQIEVDGIVFLKVMDPKRASYGIGDYRVASVNLAQTTLRSELGKMKLHDVFSEREQLNRTVVSEIDKASDPWGIKVLRYEVMNITPSAHVVHTLEKEMEAERERRAEVTIATAQKEAVSIVSQGERQEVINISEGERQKRINEAEGKAREIALISQATATSVQRVAAAIAKPGGQQAVNMQVAQQFITQLGTVLEKGKVSVIPPELGALKGVIDTLSPQIKQQGVGRGTR